MGGDVPARNEQAERKAAGGRGVLIITGASRGIGAATARRAAGQGYAVCVNYESALGEAESVVQSIEAMGGRALAVQGDVASEAQVVELFERAASLGPLKGLVNSAGILPKVAKLEAMDAERLERVFRVNVLGSLLCSREAVRLMSTARGGWGGAIVNVSSAAARIGSPGEFIDYAASKGAIDSLTLGLAKEVAREGIRVNAVRPGLINTTMHASAGQSDRVERLKSAVPMARGGEPEEVAEAILWLLSDAASYVTGTLLDVSGGR